MQLLLNNERYTFVCSTFSQFLNFISLLSYVSSDIFDAKFLTSRSVQKLDAVKLFCLPYLKQLGVSELSTSFLCHRAELRFEFVFQKHSVDC